MPRLPRISALLIAALARLGFAATRRAATVPGR